MSVPLNTTQFVAGRKTKRIPVGELHATQDDSVMDQGKISKMAGKRNDELPPVLADTEGNVQDGHHRWLSRSKRGNKTVRVVIY